MWASFFRSYILIQEGLHLKNTTKTIAAILAVLLIATLFVGAASAERTGDAGLDAFVFEKQELMEPFLQFIMRVEPMRRTTIMMVQSM